MGCAGGYLQKDLLIQCMAFKSYYFWEAVGNTRVSQAELTCKAQLPYQIFPVPVHPRSAPGGQHSPGTLITNQLLLLFLNASAAASPVTTSASVCFSPCNPHCLALLPPHMDMPPHIHSTKTVHIWLKTPNVLKQGQCSVISSPCNCWIITPELLKQFQN